MGFESPIDDRTMQAFHLLAPAICTTDAFSSVSLSSVRRTSWSLTHPTVVPELSSSRAEPQPYEARQLQLLVSTHFTPGHFIAALNCGIIARLGPLWENEGKEVVAGCLDSIWEDPASRPQLIFYDKGFALRRYRLSDPDDSYLGSRHIVDRWHGPIPI